jgi:hypothetical protein
MEEKIHQAISNSIHYLHGNESYVTDRETYVACPNKEFLTALKLELGGEIKYIEEVQNYFLEFAK